MSVPPSPRATVKRVPKRARYDRETIHAVLDAGRVCHLGFAVDGQPYVIPIVYGRDGDVLYLHGSAASRAMRQADGVDVCATVTLVDGLVVARSAFHHSLNYRSVVVLGRARLVPDDGKEHALRCITDHVLPGRWDECRPATAAELRATAVLELDLAEASAKIRAEGVHDDDEDLGLPIWAGVVPVVESLGAPEPMPDVPDGVALPAALTDRGRGTPAGS